MNVQLRTKIYFSKLVVVLFPAIALCGSTSIAQEEIKLDFYITTGEELPMCQQITEVIRDRRDKTNQICGIPLPENNPDYELPLWEALDVVENIEIVRNAYFWHNMWVSKAHPLYEKQLADRSVILPEFLDIYWNKSLPAIMSLIENDEVELWRSDIDIDADGIDERVYKMTRISTSGIRQAPWDVDIAAPRVRSSCEDIGFQDGRMQYLFYVDPKELPGNDYGGLFFPSHLVINGFLKWKGVVYWSAGDHAILVPAPSDTLILPHACAIRTIGRSMR